NDRVFVGPSAWTDMELYFGGLPPQLGGHPSVLPPGRESGGYTDVASNALSVTEYNFMIKNDRGAVVAGRIEYDDPAEQNHYRTDFCFFRFRTGALPHCDIHNQVR